MTIPLRRLDPGRHQQRRPDHRVELEDVLGEHVQVAGQKRSVRSSPSRANESAV